MFQFGPSCSNDHIRIRANMRILPNAVTNICLKTRKIILGRIKRLTKRNIYHLTKKASLSAVDPRGVQFAQNSWRAQSQFWIFSVTLFSRFFWCPSTHLLCKSSSNYIWGILGTRIMEHTCDVLWNTFWDFAVLGILRSQLKSEKPI